MSVTHSIELLLDPGSDAAIRSAWQLLADAGLPSQGQVKSPTNRPHVTLLAAQRITPDVDEHLRGLVDRLPLAAVIGAPLIFGGARVTLARLIVPSAELLALHGQVYRRALPHLTGEPYPHCQPGHWTPHVTLGRRYTAVEVGSALAEINVPEAGTRTVSDLVGSFVGLRRWDGDERVEHLLV